MIIIITATTTTTTIIIIIIFRAKILGFSCYKSGGKKLG